MFVVDMKIMMIDCTKAKESGFYDPERASVQFHPVNSLRFHHVHPDVTHLYCFAQGIPKPDMINLARTLCRRSPGMQFEKDDMTRILLSDHRFDNELVVGHCFKKCGEGTSVKMYGSGESKTFYAFKVSFYEPDDDNSVDTSVPDVGVAVSASPSAGERSSSADSGLTGVDVSESSATAATEAMIHLAESAAVLRAKARMDSTSQSLSEEAPAPSRLLPSDSCSSGEDE